MATTETPTCRRCHGTGHEPAGPTYTEEQERLLDDLYDLGTERAPLVAHRRYMTLTGRQRLNEIYDQARELIARGKALKVRKVDMEDALGVTGTAMYKIENKKTGV